MLILGAILLTIGLAMAIKVGRRFKAITEGNPYFDAYEEWLFFPRETRVMNAGTALAIAGAVLIAIAIF